MRIGGIRFDRAEHEGEAFLDFSRLEAQHAEKVGCIRIVRTLGKKRTVGALRLDDPSCPVLAYRGAEGADSVSAADTRFAYASKPYWKSPSATRT